MMEKEFNPKDPKDAIEVIHYLTLDLQLKRIDLNTFNTALATLKKYIENNNSDINKD